MSDEDIIEDFEDYETKEEWEEQPILTSWWTKAHMKKWGKEILNLPKYKKVFVKHIRTIDEDEIEDIDDYEIEPWVSVAAVDLVTMYFSIRIESILKKAFLMAASDERITLREKDVMKAIHMLDMELSGKLKTNIGTESFFSDLYFEKESD